MFKRWVILFLVISGSVQAQEISVRSKFSSDSVKLGQSIFVSLTARYPSHLTILFPDSTYNFAPFEYQRKDFWPTKTTDGISYDSVVYTVQTFEVDSIQSLRLPIFVRNRMDCTYVYAQADTVFFSHLVHHVPDSVAAQNLPLKTNTNYVNVRWQFNTILFSIIGGVLIIVLIIVWVVFGKRIRQYFALKKLQSQHKQFKEKFSTVTEKLTHEPKPELAERAVALWKGYLEDLLAAPYTKYTSKEIREKEQNEELGQSLRTIDRMIYSQISEETKPSFESLLKYGEQKYLQRVEELKHG